MDNSSTLIGLGLLLLFVGPIFYLIYSQNKKERKKFKLFKQIAAENNLQLDFTEFSKILILGLDSTSRKLLYVEPINNHQSLIIDLKTIKTCEINTIDFPHRPGKINFISLHLKPKDNKSLIEITFYDEDDNISMDADIEMQLAQKWSNLIRRQLS